MISKHSRIIYVLIGGLILILFNYGIYNKEKTLSSGEIVYFKLAPVDPRSMMQGDYMRLNYLVTDVVRGSFDGMDGTRGYLKVTLSDGDTVTDGTIHDGEPLEQDERLVRIEGRYGMVSIIPTSFFFEEGHAKYYQNAEYGVFKYRAKDDYILFGLADENKVMLAPVS